MELTCGMKTFLLKILKTTNYLKLVHNKLVLIIEKYAQ